LRLRDGGIATGGGTGIDAAAIALAQHGAAAVVLLEEGQREIESSPPRWNAWVQSRLVSTDVADEAAIEHLIAMASERLPTDAAFNNAGIEGRRAN
jgi:NAD(P)-dependent dehydrogenase (short-subunit alcohol dehydrogenase family)